MVDTIHYTSWRVRYGAEGGSIEFNTCNPSADVAIGPVYIGLDITIDSGATSKRIIINDTIDGIAYELDATWIVSAGRRWYAAAISGFTYHAGGHYIITGARFA